MKEKGLTKPNISKRETKRLVAAYERLVAEARAAGRLPPAEAPAAEVDLAPLHWYVLTVTPMCEKAVANRLKRRVPRIVTYYPLARRRVRRGGVYETAEWMVMPRYLFVGFFDDPSWLHVFDVQGVQGVLGVAGAPSEIDMGVVGDIMWRCESNQVALPLAPRPQKGMSVVARRGVMAGFEGTVKKVHKQTDLVEVFFDMVGALRPITMRLDDVVSVSYR